MAIKAIMLRKRIELKKAELAQHREKAKEFETRKSDITEAIGEATTEEEIDALNEGMDQLETEWKEHEETENRLSGEIAALEQQLTEEEQRGTPPVLERAGERIEIGRARRVAERENVGEKRRAGRRRHVRVPPATPWGVPSPDGRSCA